MSKELEALNRICEHLDLDDEYFYLKNGEKADYKVIEKSLKALEIIKEKRVDVRFLFQCKSLRDYNFIYKGTNQSKLCLTKEEYELLKEVLL